MRRGYNCLTFDGPGQGSVIRDQKLFHRYDWEKVVTPALDYALTRREVDKSNVSLMGMSLGGYFAARAAAFEPRFRAAIFFNGLFDYHASMRGQMPDDAIQALDAGNILKSQEVIYEKMRDDTDLRWNVEQSVWSFGATGIVDYLTDKVKPFTLKGHLEKIKCPCLVLDAEGDILVGAGQAQAVFDGLTAPKRMITFKKSDGAENHCESGALAFAHGEIFNWLDGVTRSSTAS